ncbi:MAG TPA: hypothetical protein VJH37_05435 [Candidatus Nanoarchaeia archaeon]|nr:hypothetical protein [Candidatus Nanoarchaeia archaeon]
MEIRINIEKKYVWLLVLALTATSLVIAYNTNPPNPSLMGHSIGEVEGVEQKITEVMDTQANTFLSGKHLAEVTRVSLGTQVPVNNLGINGQPTSLATYTTIYGRGNGDVKGCLSAMNAYCINQGYTAALPQRTSCGWAYAQDASCPDVAGCTLDFFCIKEK